MNRNQIKYKSYSIDSLDQNLIQRLRHLVKSARNSTAFHDIDFNLFISDYFVLQTFILIAFEENLILGFLIYHQKANENLIISPYQLSLSTYGGPICLSDNEEIMIGLLKQLKKQFIVGSIYIKSGPKTPGELYKKAGYKFKIIPTLLIPIDRSEDEIWKSIDNRIKRNIKKAWKYNINIFQDNGQNIDQLAVIYKELCRRKNLFYHGGDYYRQICQVFKNDAKLTIFYASINGKIISGMSVLEFDDTINPWFGGTKTEYMKTGVGSLLYWEILKYGSLKGFKIFDFLGLDIGPIAFYKKGFGGYEANVCHAGYSPLLIRIIKKFFRIIKIR